MKSRKATKEDYKRALRYASSYRPKSSDSKEKLEREWAKFRAEYRERTGAPAPSVMQYSKAFTENATIPSKASTSQAPTIDFGRDYITEFINRLTTIYQDTLNYIDTYKEGTHESGKLASIASRYIDELTRSYQSVIDEIKIYVDSGIPLDVIAQAIADNVELDYTIAIALMPPSDVQFLFDETVEQMRGIWSQINSHIEQLQEQAERELW